jgi:hypothetical protein
MMIVQRPKYAIEVAHQATSKEYRKYADECFGWVKSAKSDSDREIFLQMADTWLEVAILAEMSHTPIQPRPNT